MKLWEKSYSVNEKIIQFTVGDDYLLDGTLVYYDCVASLAHAKMLKKIDLISEEEFNDLNEGLKEIIRLNKIGKFEIKQSDEDCHTAIENYLVTHFGEVGKKIHTARSRNDQVLCAFRLYEKDQLNHVLKLLNKLIDSIDKKIKKYGKVKIPGYTHMQKAMPTTVEKWLKAYIAALMDSKELVANVLKIIDKSPLGSAAGFGIPIPIDTKYTAKELGFSKVQEELYCQNSRGKYESIIIDSLQNIMMDLNKIATDLILFSMPEFGYFSLPKELCTGSSIMPQKKNPDVLELVRARYNVVLGNSVQVKSMYSNLISGYNRDMQLTKEPMMKSFETVLGSLDVMSLVFNGLKISKDNCSKGLTKELYATKEVYKLVKKGMCFRDAYRQVGKKYIKH